MKDWSAQQYAQNARFVSDLGMPVVELLAPRRDERILDLGCGDGALTAEIAKSGCALVAVDASPDMVAATRARGLDACIASGEALAFDAEFDAVFSNAALHWMKSAPAVIDGVWRALRPGGRFVGEMGAKGNIALIHEAVNAALTSRGRAPVDPWFFPTAAEYRGLLEQRGFVVDEVVEFARPTRLPGDIHGWLKAFGHAFVAGLPQSVQEEFVTEVRQRLQPRLMAADGTWTADYVRLRFSAHKPGGPRR